MTYKLSDAIDLVRHANASVGRRAKRQKHDSLKSRYMSVRVSGCAADNDVDRQLMQLLSHEVRGSLVVNHWMYRLSESAFYQALCSDIHYARDADGRVDVFSLNRMHARLLSLGVMLERHRVKQEALKSLADASVAAEEGVRNLGEEGMG